MVKSLVTGGTGFIGAHVVKLLLERGHIVHTTVRSLNNKNKIKCLTDLQTEYPQRLFLFEADLLKDGSYTAAMEDCEVVYHIASPFMVPQQIKNGQKEIVDPAINGTKNVLKSVNDTQSVKRVVLTSSSQSFTSLTTFPSANLTQWWLALATSSILKHTKTKPFTSLTGTQLLQLQAIPTHIPKSLLNVKHGR